jgi:hypothetical protein
MVRAFSKTKFKLMKTSISISMLALTAAVALAGGNTAPTISGDYLEVRSCDVYTGPCFANAEMNLAGKEGMMLWSIRDGAWNGVELKGLNVMAVLKTDSTLGDSRFPLRSGNAVLIVDDKATAKQKEALGDFARTMADKLIGKVADVKSAPIEAKLGTCDKSGCASVKAGNLAEISTSCLGNKHHVCGNEETFYPPLSKVEGAYPVFTDVASYKGTGLDCTWQISGTRSGFLASFSIASSKPDQLAQNVSH